MAGLFEDIGRTNALGSASQTFLENAMKLRTQGNAEREAEATALRQGEMLRIQQEQEKRAERVSALAEEKARRENEAAKAKAEKMSRVRTEADILAEADARGQGQFMRHVIATAKSFGGGKAIPRPDGSGEDIYFSGQDIADAIEEQKNMSDLKTVEQGVWFAKEDAKTRFENAKKALEKKPDDPNVQKAFADAKAASLAADKDWFDFGRKMQTSGTGAAGKGTKQVYGRHPDTGVPVYLTADGISEVVINEEGQPEMQVLSPDVAKRVDKEASSHPGDKRSYIAAVRAEHPDWTSTQVEQEAARRSMGQTVSSTSTPNIAYDESGKQIGNIVIKRDRSGNMVSTVVPFPTTVNVPKAEGGGKKPVEAGGAIKETDNAQEQRLSFHSDAAVVRKALDKTLGPAFTGPVEGRLMRVEQALGIQNDKDRAKALAALKLNISTMTKAVSGLAASDQERQFILEQNPQPNDGLAELIGKYELLKERMDEYYKNDKASWRDTPTARKRLDEIWKPFSSPVATFKTEAEAREAFKKGKVKKGDRVVINGKSGTL